LIDVAPPRFRLRSLSNIVITATPPTAISPTATTLTTASNPPTPAKLQTRRNQTTYISNTTTSIKSGRTTRGMIDERQKKAEEGTRESRKQEGSKISVNHHPIFV
jgi:hypothetical protein